MLYKWQRTTQMSN